MIPKIVFKLVAYHTLIKFYPKMIVIKNMMTLAHSIKWNEIISTKAVSYTSLFLESPYFHSGLQEMCLSWSEYKFNPIMMRKNVPRYTTKPYKPKMAFLFWIILEKLSGLQ